MARRQDKSQLVEELLGSAHVFVSAVSGVMEHRLLDEVAAGQLTSSQLKILRLLDLTGAHNIGDVAAFLGVSDAAASKAVDRLVRRKYVRRTADPGDRRSFELSLARAGHTLLDRFEELKARRLAAVFADLEPLELRRTADFLERVTRGIVNDSAHPEQVCLQCGIHLKTRCLVREAARADCTYQRRKTKRQVRSHATPDQVPKGGRSGVGPPD